MHIQVHNVITLKGSGHEVRRGAETKKTNSSHRNASSESVVMGLFPSHLVCDFPKLLVLFFYFCNLFFRTVRLHDFDSIFSSDTNNLELPPDPQTIAHSALIACSSTDLVLQISF